MLRMTFRNYIGGRWADSVSGKLFENRNPADRTDLIGVFQESTPADAADAIAAAAVHTRPGVWFRRRDGRKFFSAQRSSSQSARKTSRAT